MVGLCPLKARIMVRIHAPQPVTRSSYNGIISAFQAEDAGSIPADRSPQSFMNVIYSK